MAHDLLSTSCSNLEIHHLRFQAMGEPAKPIAAPSKLLEPHISIFGKKLKVCQTQGHHCLHQWPMQRHQAHLEALVPCLVKLRLGMTMSKVQSDTFSTLLILTYLAKLHMQKNCKRNYAARMRTKAPIDLM